MHSHPWRSDFPILSRKMADNKPLIYLDSAATTQKPQCMIDAMTRFYSHEYGTVHRAIYQLAAQATHRYHAVRELARQFLNAKSTEEILFTRGTTESINLIATCFSKAWIHEGDEVLISAMEHHSNLVPWQMVCQERKAVLKIAQVDEQGCLDLDHFRSLLGPKTKIVAVTHLSNVLGTVNPIETIVKEAHKHGAKVLVDGAQSAPHLPVDVQKLDVDFFVFSGHKIYGPTGIGIAYGKKELLEQMPPYQGGGDMIEKVTFEETTYQKPPLRFEAGTPIIAETIALGASLQYVLDIGLEKIHAWEDKLLSHAMQRLREIPQVRLIGTAEKKAGVVSFSIPGLHPLDLGTALDTQGIAIRTGHLCAQPLLARYGLTSVARLSFGLYNTMEEVDECVEAIHRYVKKWL